MRSRSAAETAEMLWYAGLRLLRPSVYSHLVRPSGRLDRPNDRDQLAVSVTQTCSCGRQSSVSGQFPSPGGGVRIVDRLSGVTGVASDHVTDLLSAVVVRVGEGASVRKTGVDGAGESPEYRAF
jgi:hypothetical protein